MKKLFISTCVFIILTSASARAASTPFKVKLTEEQHKLAEQKLTDLLKGEAEKIHGEQGASAAPGTVHTSTLSDPFLPQIPKAPPPAPAAPELPPTGMPSPTPAPVRQKPVVQRPSLTISGIIWNSDRPQAIVNNQVVDVGTTFDNTTVLAINKTGIDVLYSGEKFNIPYN